MSGFGSPSQESNTLTVSPDESINLSDQAFVIQDRRKGSGNIRLGKGGMYQQGFNADEVSNLLKNALASASSIDADLEPAARTGGSTLSDVVAQRLGLNQQTAEDTATAENPLRQQKLILAGVAVVGVIAVIVALKKKA